MRVLVIGGGGREHALVRSIRKNPDLERVWCAPGNAGISRDADIPNLDVDDVQAVLRPRESAAPISGAPAAAWLPYGIIS